MSVAESHRMERRKGAGLQERPVHPVERANQSSVVVHRHPATLVRGDRAQGTRRQLPEVSRGTEVNGCEEGGAEQVQKRFHSCQFFEFVLFTHSYSRKPERLQTEAF